MLKYVWPAQLLMHLCVASGRDYAVLGVLFPEDGGEKMMKQFQG